MTAMYRVRAKRWKRGWELHIDGVGVTQAASLGEAEGMVRDYIALDLDVPPDSFDLEITHDVGVELGSAIEEAQEAARLADKARHRAAELSRSVAGRLSEAGLSGRDIAAVLSVSPQRVSQLLKG